MDREKRDLSIAVGERSFRIRAYLDNQDSLASGWHTVIIENRTPIHHELPITTDVELCLSAAVVYVNDVFGTDTTSDDRGHVHSWESEGGSSATTESRASETGHPVGVTH